MTGVTPTIVYMVCHSCEEGYVVDSVWSTREKAEQHIADNRWEREVANGVTWINDEPVH